MKSNGKAKLAALEDTSRTSPPHCRLAMGSGASSDAGLSCLF